jgi:MFS family permease
VKELTAAPSARPRFADVFGVVEFRALWVALMLSVAGDQLARVALTVLVYERTRSAMLAAVAFAAGIVPMFIGSVTLSGLADRLPRRRVMIGADLASGILVVLMALPRVPSAALIMLLFAVTMLSALFLAARAATYPEILDGERYALGVAVSWTTIMFAQVVGFAAGGAVVAFLGLRASLFTDAATFGASALIIRMWLRARPASAAPRPPGSSGPRPARAPGRRAPRVLPAAADIVAGLRLVLGHRAMRTPVLFGWLVAFYELPDGVATPLAKEVGGGAITVGLILAAQLLGSAVGALGFSRLADHRRRMRWTGPLAVASCAPLIIFAARPSLPGILLILCLSGLFGCYQIAANTSFVQATPAALRSQAFGIAQGGISLGEGVAVILAGAAAQYVTPDLVIAGAGAIGALCALALAVTTAKPDVARS